MEERRSLLGRVSFRLIPFFMAQYMVLCMVQSYFPVYLTDIGVSDSVRGLLLSLAPLAALPGQPVWGNLGDRVRWKNTLLLVLALASAVLMVLLGLVREIWVLALLYGSYSFFYGSIQPMGDAVTLESLRRARLPFGPVRVSGTVAFATLSAASGLFLAGHPERCIPVSAGLLLLTAGCSLLMPRVEGHRRAGDAGGFRALLKNRTLMILMLFSGLMMVSMTIFYNAFSVYFTRELGGSSKALGWCYFLSAMSELPFLLLSDRILRRFSIGRLLCLSAGVMAVRWLILGLTESWVVALCSQTLHCGCFLFMSFSMIHYTDSVTPPQYKAAGQILYTLFTLSIAKFVGSLLGGVVSQALGTGALFLCSAGFTFCVFLGLVLYTRKHRAELAPAAERTAAQSP